MSLVLLASRHLVRKAAAVNFASVNACRTLVCTPENKAKLLFDNFQFAPAAGQTAAIYDGDIIIGSGVIDYTF